MSGNTIKHLIAYLAAIKLEMLEIRIGLEEFEDNSLIEFREVIFEDLSYKSCT